MKIDGIHKLISPRLVDGVKRTELTVKEIKEALEKLELSLDNPAVSSFPHIQ
jgi:hypothetical protein